MQLVLTGTLQLSVLAGHRDWFLELSTAAGLLNGLALIIATEDIDRQGHDFPVRFFHVTGGPVMNDKLRLVDLSVRLNYLMVEPCLSCSNSPYSC